MSEIEFSTLAAKVRISHTFTPKNAVIIMNWFVAYWTLGIFSNYWIRLSYILRKSISIIALFFIQNISTFLKEFSHFALFFHRSRNTTQPCPQVFSVNRSIICSGLHFWRHFGVIGSIIFGGLHFLRHWFNMANILSKFGKQQLVMVNYACVFNHSETGK